MFRARSDTLDLNHKNKHKGKDTTCPACGLEEETLEHFLLHCTNYKQIRQDYSFLARPYKEDAQDIMANALLFKLDETFDTGTSYVEDRKQFVKRMWKMRSQILREATANA